MDALHGRVLGSLDRAHYSLPRGLTSLLMGAVGRVTGSSPSLAQLPGGGGAPSAPTSSGPQQGAGQGRTRPANATGAAVTDVACTPDGGIVSCGSDGVVRYHTLADLVTRV